MDNARKHREFMCRVSFKPRRGLTFTTTGASSAATVELTLAAVCRDRPGIVVLEDRAQVPAVLEGDVPWPYTREVSLPPGITHCACG